MDLPVLDDWCTSGVQLGTFLKWKEIFGPIAKQQVNPVCSQVLLLISDIYLSFDLEYIKYCF